MRRPSRASPAACRASLTFTSCLPVISPFCRLARRSLRPTCCAFVPIRPASTERPFTATSTRALYGSFANILLAMVQLA